jgi:predicted CxxxxCH...CXXCH cytochrome family protein
LDQGRLRPVTKNTGKLRRRSLTAATCAIMGLAACGGGTVSDPPLSGAQVLAFAYFQRCVNPIFQKPLQITLNGVAVTNQCSNPACHNNSTGAGGAFRIIPTLQTFDLTNPANTPDVIRASDIYKNFVSAQGETVVGAPTQSLLIRKPLLQGIFHGGGQIFANDQDPNVKLMEYWIANPAPQGQDEFSAATYAMFTPADPNNGACKTN